MSTGSSSQKDIIVGVDLGTSYTSVSAVIGKKVRVLANSRAERVTPSVIAFPTADEIVVGVEARQRLATDPSHTVSSPKRLLGRPFSDREVQSFTGSAPYRTLQGPDGTTIVEMWGQPYAIPQLVAKLLQEAREIATKELATPVGQAVLTVPVSFDQARVDALRRAGELAQLHIRAVIEEPNAVALANRFDPKCKGLIGVYDFGGGTFDFSVVDVAGGNMTIRATSGDPWLGGDDFDSALAEAAANQFWRAHKVDLRRQAVEWQRLMFAAEKAKRTLSEHTSAGIEVPEILRTASGMLDLNLTVDRRTFELVSKPIIDRSLRKANEALRHIKAQPSDLTAVYLSGGTTYIPIVRSALADYFGVPIRAGVPPEHAVCLGAAIHAAQLRFGKTVLPSR